MLWSPFFETGFFVLQTNDSVAIKTRKRNPDPRKSNWMNSYVPNGCFRGKPYSKTTSSNQMNYGLPLDCFCYTRPTFGETRTSKQAATFFTFKYLAFMRVKVQEFKKNILLEGFLPILLSSAIFVLAIFSLTQELIKEYEKPGSVDHSQYFQSQYFYGPVITMLASLSLLILFIVTFKCAPQRYARKLSHVKKRLESIIGQSCVLEPQVYEFSCNGFSIEIEHHLRLAFSTRAYWNYLIVLIKKEGYSTASFQFRVLFDVLNSRRFKKKLNKALLENHIIQPDELWTSTPTGINNKSRTNTT